MSLINRTVRRSKDISLLQDHINDHIARIMKELRSPDSPSRSIPDTIGLVNQLTELIHARQWVEYYSLHIYIDKKGNK